jgi:hypothetical protein
LRLIDLDNAESSEVYDQLHWFTNSTGFQARFLPALKEMRQIAKNKNQGARASKLTDIEKAFMAEVSVYNPLQHSYIFNKSREAQITYLRAFKTTSIKRSARNAHPLQKRSWI